MGKEQDQGTTSGMPSKETVRKWAIRVGLIAVAIIGLTLIL